MGLLNELSQMTADEWALFCVATVLCVGGLLLPKAGNMLGRAFLGEDPAVKSWRQKWQARRELRRSVRAARRAEKKRRKAERKAKRAARKAASTTGKTSTGTAGADSSTA